MDKKDPKDELKSSFKHWQNYTGDLGFKAVFVDGKLKYFREGTDGEFFDVNDKSHNEIEYKDKPALKSILKTLYVEALEIV